MNRRGPLDDLPENYFLEAREPRLARERLLELALIGLVAFITTMGGVVAGGSWIFLTQREATIMRAEIATNKMEVSILSTQFHDHVAFTVPNDTPSRTASMYPGAHR